MPGVAKGRCGVPSHLFQPVRKYYKLLFGTCGVSAAGILFLLCLLRSSLARASNGRQQQVESQLEFTLVFCCQPSVGVSIEVAFDLQSLHHHLALYFLSPRPIEYHDR